MPQAQSVAIPKRLPLIIEPSNRDESTRKDAKLVNCYVERVGEGESAEVWLYKRPGIDELSRPPAGNANGYGTYNWLGDVYAVFGAALYKNGVSIGAVNAAGGLYTFTQSKGATPRLVLGNGIFAYTWDNTTLAVIADPDFPAAFVKGWSYLDATTYLSTAAAAIRGSDLNDPTAWDPLNTITAQIEPDNAVATAKQLVYTLQLKQWSTEVFYDAANSTGSPLSPVQGAKMNYGCVHANSIQEIEGALVWLAVNRSAAVSVLILDNLKVTSISTKPIERLLDQADFTTVFSWHIKFDGHKFYVLTLKEENLTLVYDLVDKVWHQWTDENGNYFPIVSATYNSSLQHILQHETNGRLYLMDSTYYSDDGQYITVDIVTPNFDGGVNREKQCGRLTIIGDQVAGSILQVRTNDYDYATNKWTNFRNIDLSQKNPFISDMGSFVHRAHNFRHRCNTQMRIQAAELQLDIGTL